MPVTPSAKRPKSDKTRTKQRHGSGLRHLLRRHNTPGNQQMRDIRLVRLAVLLVFLLMFILVLMFVFVLIFVAEATLMSLVAVMRVVVAIIILVAAPKAQRVAATRKLDVERSEAEARTERNQDTREQVSSALVASYEKHGKIHFER